MYSSSAPESRSFRVALYLIGHQVFHAATHITLWKFSTDSWSGYRLTVAGDSMAAVGSSVAVAEDNTAVADMVLA